MLVSFHPSLSGTRRTSWLDAARVARVAGFGAIDLDISTLEHGDPGRIVRTLAAEGLTAGACSLPVELRRDESTFEDGLRRLERIAATAGAVGLRVMHRSIPASSDLPRATLEPILRARWGACATVLREHAIGLAVEPLGTPYRRREGQHEFITRLDDAAAFATSCGEGVGLLVDSWHWYLSGAGPSEIAAVGGLISHVHVADVPDMSAELLRDDQRVPAGDGVVDFMGFRAGLDRAGYDGLVGPELPGDWSLGMSPLDAARRGLQTTLAALQS